MVPAGGIVGGIALTPATGPEELAAFIARWQAEGKVFTIQWQQKLAHICNNCASNNGQPNAISTLFSEPDKQILMDSEVRNENVGDLMKRDQKDDASHRETCLLQR